MHLLGLLSQAPGAHAECLPASSFCAPPRVVGTRRTAPARKLSSHTPQHDPAGEAATELLVMAGIAVAIILLILTRAHRRCGRRLGGDPEFALSGGSPVAPYLSPAKRPKRRKRKSEDVRPKEVRGARVTAAAAKATAPASVARASAGEADATAPQNVPPQEPSTPQPSLTRPVLTQLPQLRPTATESSASPASDRDSSTHEWPIDPSTAHRPPSEDGLTSTVDQPVSKEGMTSFTSEPSAESPPRSTEPSFAATYEAKCEAAAASPSAAAIPKTRRRRRQSRTSLSTEQQGQAPPSKVQSVSSGPAEQPHQPSPKDDLTLAAPSSGPRREGKTKREGGEGCSDDGGSPSGAGPSNSSSHSRELAITGTTSEHDAFSRTAPAEAIHAPTDSSPSAATYEPQAEARRAGLGSSPLSEGVEAPQRLLRPPPLALRRQSSLGCQGQGGMPPLPPPLTIVAASPALLGEVVPISPPPAQESGQQSGPTTSPDSVQSSLSISAQSALVINALRGRTSPRFASCPPGLAPTPPSTPTAALPPGILALASGHVRSAPPSPFAPRIATIGRPTNATPTCYSPPLKARTPRLLLTPPHARSAPWAKPAVAATEGAAPDGRRAGSRSGSQPGTPRTPRTPRVMTFPKKKKNRAAQAKRLRQELQPLLQLLAPSPGS
ncbi:hypothetical protein EMIHUDRAFT_246053 [Emiliania huxleyi CCMP1516]|uniref:Uncharacterized protein n=2 Tax=Emiliania huxleyi TaxID=2903 RepID=A0A0D3IV55_EMIH1|nr:hypothetical protein EMIHUDRAFT_246053 [Emiliania huxleyi CCMP1516]EOD15140.1 hypothetical protein EMIHUDRAFT_246053 [Emiliania huxleyi CCMP1516]|eukprot:XP_005767569.1 hypothetical protein EMIHUDRAFT_246053 [Emiliania huxleyi CCMP1516]